MADRGGFIGRRGERERLDRALERARRGQGALVLVAGEAGIGKTRLLEELAAGSGALVLRGRAREGAVSPYGPVVAALRAHLREHPGALAGIGPLGPHLAPILPELGDAAAGGDRATLVEAVLSALAHVAQDGPAILILDDLQWSDDATLELLGPLAESLERLPLLAVGAHRSGGLPRDHLIRRVRQELRRSGRLDEIALAPLTAEETTLLSAGVLGREPAPSLAAVILERTQGLPFFVEELARALLVAGVLAEGPDGPRLAARGEVPLPDTIREAVLMSASDLSPRGRSAAEAAAVAGEVFDLDVVARASSPEGLAELIERDVVREDRPGAGAFRHALTRESLYADVPWLQRRALHHRLAEDLEARGAPALEVATHWLGARDERRAREALLRAAGESRAVHAHRDAARAGRQALDLWPAGEEDERRIAVLQDYAGSAERSGDLAEAVRAWREICAMRADPGAGEALGHARRRLAAVHDLAGDREAASASRRIAADAYSAAGRPAEAAVERLAIVEHLRLASRLTPAIELARAAGEEALAAERLDLRARALGLEGLSRAARGEYEAGRRTVQEALALALEHGMIPVAAELYQRLSSVLYDAADYRGAQEALDSAIAFCRVGEEPGIELACVACLVYVLRERGDWPGSLDVGRALLADESLGWMGEGLLGTIHAFQGRLGPARRMLSGSLAAASRLDEFNMIADTTASLAWVAAAEGDDEEAARLCRSLLSRWERSEDRHLVIRGLRWGAGFLARRGDLDDAHACAEALSRIAATTGHADALAALAHAIGETALAGGDAATAAVQLTRAVEIHRALEIPYERAEIDLRAGVALAAAGDRPAALERLAEAHRSARRLGARPLAAEAAREVGALGESVAGVLGTRAAHDPHGSGLSRRELEVVRLVVAGQTNREIARELFLSHRTVDMHVRNLLRKLDCRSRTQAARRAAELGLVG